VLVTDSGRIRTRFALGGGVSFFILEGILAKTGRGEKKIALELGEEKIRKRDRKPSTIYRVYLVKKRREVNLPTSSASVKWKEQEPNNGE